VTGGRTLAVSDWGWVFYLSLVITWLFLIFHFPFSIFHFPFFIFHFSLLIFRNHPSTVKIGRFIVFGEGRKNGKWKMENGKWKMTNKNTHQPTPRSAALFERSAP